jgi:hypothetical protein
MPPLFAPEPVRATPTRNGKKRSSNKVALGKRSGSNDNAVNKEEDRLLPSPQNESEDLLDTSDWSTDELPKRKIG